MKAAGASKDIETRLLLEAIFERYQHDFRAYSPVSIQRRLAAAMEHFDCRSVSMLQDRVLHDAEAMLELLNFITIQVSEFFRDPSFFRAVREQVVPHLRTYPSLKVWVAGCADGEELYSLAILFREEGLEARTLFYATDVNPSALKRAEAGVYVAERIPLFTRNHRLSGGKTSLSDYYTAAYNGAIFDRSLRERVVFADHSLASDQTFAEVHLISCRNVLIYFEKNLQDRAVGLFTDSLVHNGFLGLGAQESVRFSSHSGRFSDFVAQERIYRLTGLRPGGATF